MRCSRRPKGLIKRKSPKNPWVTSPKLIGRSTISMVAPTHMSPRKQKLIAWEVIAVSPATLEYFKWCEVPITFDRSDHPEFVPKLGRFPLIVSPIIKDVKLN
jgi:hypothetical protein